jgi:hypothetical protein
MLVDLPALPSTSHTQLFTSSNSPYLSEPFESSSISFIISNMPRAKDRDKRRVKVRAPGYVSRNPSVDPQLQSNLCQLPIELLSEIAGYIFSGFKLHYCSTSCIYKPKEISTRQLALVRTCQLLRRMLIPVLAAHTTELIFESHLRHETKVRSDQIDSTTIKMSHHFRAGTRDIYFTGDTIRFPNYKLFPNLERIHMEHAPRFKPGQQFMRGKPSIDEWLVELSKRHAEVRRYILWDSGGPQWSYIGQDQLAKLAEGLHRIYDDKERLAAGVHLIDF